MIFYICFALGLVFVAATSYYRWLWKTVDSQSCYRHDLYSVALGMAKMDYYFDMQNKMGAIAICLIGFAIGGFVSCN